MTVLIESIEAWQEARQKLGGRSLGLVPTMGNLHAGHMSLVSSSIMENDATVLSCFVNPTQFNNKNDLDKYPRILEDDMALCRDAGVDYVFAPNYQSMYPDDYRYQISEKELSALMEGGHRPGHFDGMLTIVLKLLLLMKADRAYFGEKDYQQLQLVWGMAEAFFLETEVVACKTVRDDSGLALSSRNQRLTEDQLALSQNIHKYLHSKLSCDEIITKLQSKGFEVEYVQEHRGRRFAAVRLGDVRLIDNVEV